VENPIRCERANGAGLFGGNCEDEKTDGEKGVNNIVNRDIISAGEKVPALPYMTKNVIYGGTATFWRGWETNQGVGAKNGHALHREPGTRNRGKAGLEGKSGG